MSDSIDSFIETFFVPTNEALTNENHQLLKSANSMDQALLNYIIEHGILIPIGPVEDKDSRYKVYNTAVDVIKQEDG